jgi:hypothetical protein
VGEINVLRVFDLPARPSEAVGRIMDRVPIVRALNDVEGHAASIVRQSESAWVEGDRGEAFGRLLRAQVLVHEGLERREHIRHEVG